MQLLGEHYIISGRDFLALKAIAGHSRPHYWQQHSEGCDFNPGLLLWIRAKAQESRTKRSQRDENELAGMTVLGLD